ncbi:hypothetical protein BCR34DRAFT_354402 [Clohesyomyces aquaticus]|uniref:Uncharacterized protein n=1 Tax=Clohesyomyces aquaticus TaxID=1231657 RepID=A0A1Y1ZJ33_9PLEO|nr:hypothetical protein BCR34DRAFT_354402 [Clohesyomyces aquaticus]
MAHTHDPRIRPVLQRNFFGTDRCPRSDMIDSGRALRPALEMSALRSHSALPRSSLMAAMAADARRSTTLVLSRMVMTKIDSFVACSDVASTFSVLGCGFLSMGITKRIINQKQKGVEKGMRCDHKERTASDPRTLGLWTWELDVDDLGMHACGLGEAEQTTPGLAVCAFCYHFSLANDQSLVCDHCSLKFL